VEIEGSFAEIQGSCDGYRGGIGLRCRDVDVGLYCRDVDTAL